MIARHIDVEKDTWDNHIHIMKHEESLQRLGGDQSLESKFVKRCKETMCACSQPCYGCCVAYLHSGCLLQVDILPPDYPTVSCSDSDMVGCHVGLGCDLHCLLGATECGILHRCLQ